jgi:hypothetical protein
VDRDLILSDEGRHGGVGRQSREWPKRLLPHLDDEGRIVAILQEHELTHGLKVILDAVGREEVRVTVRRSRGAIDRRIGRRKPASADCTACTRASARATSGQRIPDSA